MHKKTCIVNACFITEELCMNNIGKPIQDPCKFILHNSMHDISTIYRPYIMHDFKSNVMLKKTCIVNACFTNEELFMNTLGKPTQYPYMFILHNYMHDVSTIYCPYIIHDFKSNIMHKKPFIVAASITNEELCMNNIGKLLQYPCMFILHNSMHVASTIYCPYIIHDFKSNIMHK
jgi:hypothetical protein